MSYAVWTTRAGNNSFRFDRGLTKRELWLFFVCIDIHYRLFTWQAKGLFGKAWVNECRMPFGLHMPEIIHADLTEA